MLRPFWDIRAHLVAMLGLCWNVGPCQTHIWQPSCYNFFQNLESHTITAKIPSKLKASSNCFWIERIQRISWISTRLLSHASSWDLVLVEIRSVFFKSGSGETANAAKIRYDEMSCRSIHDFLQFIGLSQVAIKVGVSNLLVQLHHWSTAESQNRGKVCRRS